MPRTFPVILEVEDIALASVLRKLHDMPGIAKLGLDLGPKPGGEGPGKEQLAKAVQIKHAKGKDAARTVLQLLYDNGPTSAQDLHRAIGGAKGRAYVLLSTLKKRGLTEANGKRGHHQLTKGARAMMEGGEEPGSQPMLALPAPAHAKRRKRGKDGRALPGSGNRILRSVLNGHAVPGGELRAAMAKHGMSPKSVSGVLDRAKRDGFIRRGADGYSLTAKGHKLEA